MHIYVGRASGLSGREVKSARIRYRARTVAELQLRLLDVYKGGEGTASRLRLPQHAGGLSRLDIPGSLAGPYTSLYNYGVNLPHPLLCLLTKPAERKGEVN